MFVLEVSGMGCGSCVSKITNAIKARDHAAQVEVDRATGKVMIESNQSPDQLCSVLQELGYPTKISA